MAYHPDYLTNISLILSRVMNDIGVNEECVMRRRRTNLVSENILNLGNKLVERDISCHIFGSQTEGTTIDCLHSDIDTLGVYEDYIVIEDIKDWVPGMDNYLMLRDEARYPGYCRLQVLRNDDSLPLCGYVPVGCDSFANDRDGTITLKNPGPKLADDFIRHGPADKTVKGGIEYDFVVALKCKTWPNHYKQWTPNDKVRDWPTTEMIKYMKTTGCFVVKAVHPLDEYKETWRISTSLAERCLMFSLNITQIRCYVLLKMIVKTFIEPHMPDTLSSYMCKTMLFHCIEHTSKDLWKAHNLLKCVHNVLVCMSAAVRDDNWSNYFNMSANLLFGKVTDSNKYQLLTILRFLIKTRGRFLLNIDLSNINCRLSTYIIDRNHVVSQEEIDDVRLTQYRPVLLELLKGTCEQVNVLRRNFRSDLKPINFLSQMIRDVSKQERIQIEAAWIVMPFLCSYLATVEASKCICQGTKSTPVTLKLFELSLHSDVTSSRLKFASYLYCTGQLERTLSVLKEVEQRLANDVLIMCACHFRHDFEYPSGFGKQELSGAFPRTTNLAMNVVFSKDEIHCCPRELQYELFRSTDEERQKRTLDDNWMDLVVMDSLPYLYILQYKTYTHLGQRDRQYMALDNLFACVRYNKYLTHRETAMNVLGQCMEYEGDIDMAFECYRISLQFRPTNNAVRWHIMWLLWLVSQSQ